MTDKNVNKQLPEALVLEIQKYVDGAYIYIPTKSDTRKAWGTQTGSRRALMERNQGIYKAYLNGVSSRSLSERYFLSLKSIQRIILAQKKCHDLVGLG